MNDINLCVIGLGYVGLPLAVEFSKQYKVIGYDKSKLRINELKSNIDVTCEVTTDELKNTNIIFTDEEKEIKKSNVYIVTVPTPIDGKKNPDLSPLINVSKLLSKNLSKGDIVIYESTVYPGVTEEVCLPFLLSETKLIYNQDFYLGYSPERINPGDKINRFTNISKVVSGSTEEVLDLIYNLYSSIIDAPIHKTNTIKEAEASKLIENIQRDVNIALINELYQILSMMNIDIYEVLKASGTKWNFMKLLPGLVGGHCIGVDPYYLIDKSSSIGYVPDLIRTSREINDNMSTVIANNFIKELIKSDVDFKKQPIALLGFAFKENCPDIRNTKIYDLYLKLVDYGLTINVYDPIVDHIEVYNEYNLTIATGEITEKIALLILPHNDIINSIKTEQFDFIYDFKNILKKV